MGAISSIRRAAVFVDKDGTVVDDVPFNADPRRISFLEGAREGLASLQRAGFALVLATNQSGIGHRYFDERQFRAYVSAFESLLAERGIVLDGVEYCPHHPVAADRRYRRVCACRKPNPGMLVRAAEKAGYDLEASWMIGDTGDDVEAGHRAGCRSVLVGAGDAAPGRDRIRVPEARVVDLREAAEVIVRASAVSTARERALV